MGAARAQRVVVALGGNAIAGEHGSDPVSQQRAVEGAAGTPGGIDCREVVRVGGPPFVNTGIAHRKPGVGQIGAGLVEPPVEAFANAVRALAGAG